MFDVQVEATSVIEVLLDRIRELERDLAVNKARSNVLESAIMQMQNGDTITSGPAVYEDQGHAHEETGDIIAPQREEHNHAT